MPYMLYSKKMLYMLLGIHRFWVCNRLYWVCQREGELPKDETLTVALSGLNWISKHEERDTGAALAKNNFLTFLKKYFGENVMLVMSKSDHTL